MIHVFFAEVRKLRRPSLSLATLVTVAVLTGLFTSLVFLRIGKAGGNGREGVILTAQTLSKANGVVYAFQLVGFFLGIVALCIFASQTAQEYSYGTLRNLLVRQPARMKILLGKYLAMVFFTLVLVTFAAIISIALSYALSGHGHVNTTLWSSSSGIHFLSQAFGNIFLSAVGYGTVGMILGLLLRSPISSIAVGVIWFLILENILAGVVTSSGKWLPGQNLSNLAAGGDPVLSYQRSLLTSGGYLIVFSLVAAFLFKRRDVAN